MPATPRQARRASSRGKVWCQRGSRRRGCGFDCQPRRVVRRCGCVCVCCQMESDPPVFLVESSKAEGGLTHGTSVLVTRLGTHLTPYSRQTLPRALLKPAHSFRFLRQTKHGWSTVSNCKPYEPKRPLAFQSRLFQKRQALLEAAATGRSRNPTAKLFRDFKSPSQPDAICKATTPAPQGRLKSQKVPLTDWPR